MTLNKTIKDRKMQRIEILVTTQDKKIMENNAKEAGFNSVDTYLKFLGLLGSSDLKIDIEMIFQKKAKKLRELAIDKNYDPDYLAQYFLNVPSVKWEQDGLYNLGSKYSSRALSNFLSQIKNLLCEEIY